MRFLLDVLVGYSMRGKKKLLITVLPTIAFSVYIILPAVALRLDVQQECKSRPAQTRVPALKGLSYGAAEIKLRASNLHIRVLATRYNLPVEPGLIIDQVPQPGEEVVYVTLLASPSLRIHMWMVRDCSTLMAHSLFLMA